MRTEASLLVLALVLVACSTPLPPHAPGLDGAGVDAWRMDTGPVIVPPDTGPRDSGVMDASFDSNVDAPLPDVGPVDAGPPIQITVDGVLTDPYWSTAGLLSSTIVASSAFDGDALTALHFGRDDAWFYLGFEGTLVVGDAVVVYIDTDAAGGVLLSTGLGDGTNTVNATLSLQITGTAEFQPEYGWGTSLMPHVLTTTDATLGWRALAASPGHFTNVTANTRSACSDMGCETVMLLDQIGVLPGGLLNLVVRLGRPAGSVGFSNQTFPVSDTATPETIDIPVMVPVAP